MSTFQTTQARVSACIRGIRSTILPAWEEVQQAIVEGWNSDELRLLTDDLRDTEVTGLSDLESAWARVADQVPGFERLPDSAYGRFATFESSLEDLQNSSEDGHADDRANDVWDLHAELVDAVSEASVVTGYVERLTATEAAALALPDLGYTITRADGETASAIEASRGNQTVLVLVEDGGRLTTDWIGLSDGSCVERQSEFIEQLARYGVELDDDARIERHNDPRGGQLVAAAARHRAASRAEGAVIEADRANQARATRTLFDPAATRSRTFLSEGGR